MCWRVVCIRRGHLLWWGEKRFAQNQGYGDKKRKQRKNVLFSMKSHCLRVLKCALGAERGQEQILCE